MEISQSQADMPSGSRFGIPEEPKELSRRDPKDAARWCELPIADLRDRPLHAVFEHAFDAMVIVDDEGRYLDVNPSACELFGLSRDALLGRRLSDFALTTEDFLTGCEQMTREACQGEFCLLRPDGSMREVEYSATPNVLPHRHLSILRDVTALKQAEAEVHRLQVESELQEDTAQFREIFESTNAGLVYSDATGYLMGANQTFRDITGYTQKDLRSLNFRDITHPDDLPQEDAYLRSLLTKEISDYTLEKRYIRKDGTLIWVSVTVSAVWEQTGVPRYAIAVVQDITHRKRFESVLQQYERIVSATPDGIALLDQNYTYLVVNQAYLDWYYKQSVETVGHSMAELLGIEGFQTLKPYLDQALQGEVVRCQLWFPYPELGNQFIGITCAPYQDEAGMPVGVVLTTRNLTDLKRAEIALQQQAEQERLLRTITEHIRQTLDLTEILNITVNEVMALLQCDRVLIFRFYPNHLGKVETEALKDDCPSLAGETYLSNCLMNCYTRFCQQQPRVVDDVPNCVESECPIADLLAMGVRAQTLVPILHQQNLWGLLIAQQCNQVRHWQDWEVDLMAAIANQVSIAIHQAHLYRQVQQFNVRLEKQVQERTIELWQSLHFEALLKRITDNVRDSLDEQQILQTAVRELVQGVEIECCDAGIYNANQTLSTIAYEFTRTLKPAQGRTFAIVDAPHAEVYQHLLQGRICQFCDLEPNLMRSERRLFAVLACPIVDDQGVLGDLWLFKHRGEIFNDLEMRLVQQVANQCAIALRQSRLYQAAQAQVQELERLNRLKDDFLSTVSHELRTPMSNIKMATQMLQISLEKLELLEPGTRITQYFQILDHECQRETTLINDLLDLSRLESKTDPLLLNTIDLKIWIPAIIEPFEQRILEHQQQLQICLPPDLPLLPTDLKYLERILSELLQNACKYTPIGETITVSAEAIANTAVQITLCNSGVGIPPNELNCIFDKFYRVPNNDPWKYGGTGLGLTLVKKLVEQLKGRIEARSANQQVSFTITLPLTLPQGDRPL